MATPVRPALVPPKPVLPKPTLFVQAAGETAAISVTDIHQGQLGDCFLMAAIGELALVSPATIAGLIHTNADGTESVRLYGDATGHLPGYGTSVFKAMTQAVTNSFDARSVNNAASQGVANGLKEIWPQVLEKAYAQAAGGYNAIAHGGNPALALAALTGHRPDIVLAVGSLTAAQLRADAVGKTPVVFDTGARPSDGLIRGHAYMFEGMARDSHGADCVKVGNPWGTTAPSLVPVSHLAQAFVEVDIGHLA